MKNETTKSIDQEIKQWAEYLVIQEVCTPIKTEANSYLKDSHMYSLNKQPDYAFSISQFINPFFVSPPQQKNSNPNPDAALKICIENSQNNENLSLLLNSVQQLPKLRYQQSSKFFPEQSPALSSSQSVKDQSQVVNNNPTKLNFQFSSNKNSKRPQIFSSQKTPVSKTVSKFQFQKSANHKVLDLQEISNQENQIQASMSVKSNEIHITRENDIESKSFSSHLVKGSKNAERGQLLFTNNQKQAEQRSKQQRSMIQSYFESAKNRVFENCSLNCCEGIFEKTQQTPTPNQTLNLKYGQQSVQKPFKKK